jgi:hypothetical protein
MIQNIKAELESCEKFRDEVQASADASENLADHEYSSGASYVINRIWSRIND